MKLPSAYEITQVKKFQHEISEFEYQSTAVQRILNNESIAEAELDAHGVNQIALTEWVSRYTLQKSSDLLVRTIKWYHQDQLSLEQVSVLIERGMLSLREVMAELWPVFYAQSRELGKRSTEVIDEWLVDTFVDAFGTVIARPASENAAECERILAEFEAFDKKWGPLQDIKSPPRELPVDVLPSRIKDFVEAASEAFETSTDTFMGSVLGALGAATAGTVRVKINNTHDEPLNPAMLTLAGSGEKKSGASKLVLRALKAEEQQIVKADVRANSERKVDIDILKREIALLERGGGDDAKKSGSGGAGKKSAGGSKASAEDIAKEMAAVKAAGSHSVAAAAASVEDLRNKKLKLEYLEMPRLQYKVNSEDITPEAFVYAMSRSWTCTSVIISDETNMFSQVSGLYGGQNKMQHHLKAISGDDDSVTRRNGTEIYVPWTHAHMLLMMQPDEFNSYLKKNPSAMSTGLVARFNTIFPHSLLGLRPHKDAEVDPVALSKWENLLLAMKRAALEYIEKDVERQKLENAARDIPEADEYVKYRHITVPHAGLVLWREWKRKREKDLGKGGRYHPIASWYSKALNRALIFAALFTLSDDPLAAEVSAAYVPAGIALVEALSEHALYVMESGDEIYSHQTLAAVKAVHQEMGLAPGDEGCTTAMVQAKVRGQQWMKVENPSRRLEDVLNNLSDLGYLNVETARSGGRGRPKKFVVLRPFELV